MSMPLIEEPQKYKIYINEVEVILQASKDLDFDEIKEPQVVAISYDGDKKHVLDHIIYAEKSEGIQKLILHFHDFETIKYDFKSHFTQIKAAGGLVKNELDEYLFIHRRGSWDLPKGKIDLGESKRQAAIREVEEETGLKTMEIIERLGVTRHVYRSNLGRRIIKKSYWYLMEAKKQRLIPQISEDILEAKWLSLPVFFNEKRKVYPNILDVIHTQDTDGIENNVKVKVK